METLSQLLFSSIVDDDKSSTGPSPLLLEIDDDDDDDGDENNNDGSTRLLLLVTTGANNRGVVVGGGVIVVTKASQLQHEKICNSAAAAAAASRRRLILRLADVAGMVVELANYREVVDTLPLGFMIMVWVVVVGVLDGAGLLESDETPRVATYLLLYPDSRHFRLNLLPAILAKVSLPRVGCMVATRVTRRGVCSRGTIPTT